MAWHLARRLLLKHPLLGAELGIAAAREAARFAIAEKLAHHDKDRHDAR